MPYMHWNNLRVIETKENIKRNCIMTPVGVKYKTHTEGVWGTGGSILAAWWNGKFIWKDIDIKAVEERWDQYCKKQLMLVSDIRGRSQKSLKAAPGKLSPFHSLPMPKNSNQVTFV